MKKLLPLLGVIPFAIVVACSDSDDTTPDTSDAATADEPFVPNPNNCVKPGATGNDKGVGAYCDPTQTCPKSSDKNVFLICTSIDKSTPTDSFFCTAPCTLDSDCGENAFCAKQSAGAGCVPFSCGTPPDSDGGSDANDSTDASDDVSSDDAGDGG